ncbi:hypothetical protein Pd630_LPD03831 [Rhodococcus opacus PD630]|nr:hypothetical protein Pd630_LPD03831 [Rhodococcus opacus PD630]
MSSSRSRRPTGRGTPAPERYRSVLGRVSSGALLLGAAEIQMMVPRDDHLAHRGILG